MCGVKNSMNLVLTKIVMCGIPIRVTESVLKHVIFINIWITKIVFTKNI